MLAPERPAEAEAEAGPAANVAGGAVDVDEGDEAAVCGALFKGLVFFMGCAPPHRAEGSGLLRAQSIEVLGLSSSVR